MREQKLHIEKGNLISRDLLFAYLNNELDVQEKLCIEQLIAEDEFLQDAVDGLKNADPVTVNKSLDKIYNDIDILTGAKKPFVISQSVRMYAAAASLILIVSLTFILIGRLNNAEKNTGIAINTTKETVDSIIPDTTSMESDMGGGMKEEEKFSNTDTVATAAPMKKAEPASGEVIAYNIKTTTENIAYNPGDAIIEKALDAEDEFAKEDLALSTPAQAEVFVREETTGMAEIPAPFTTSNVASANETYTISDKDVAVSKTSDEKFKKIKGRKESKEETVTPSSVDRSYDVTDGFFYKDDTNKDSTAIYLTPEIMPQFPGGQDSLLNYLRTNLHYPLVDVEFEGNVYVKFIINENGIVSDAQIVKGLAPAFDMEALRVVNQMPAWIPGKQHNIPVKTYFTLVVKFSGK